MANIRIKDLSTDSALSAGDYVVVDSASEGSRKFDLGTELTSIKEDIENISGISDDVKTALLQIAQKVAYIDDDGADYYQDLYDALYPPVQTYTVTNTLTGCTTNNAAASVTENTPYSATITASSGYSLTGATVSITMGGTDITSTAYNNGTISIASVTGNLIITVTAVAVTLSSISAVYTQSGTVYTSDSLDSLKTDLVVTATWSDTSTSTVASADYTLSGTLTEGTSTITVTYEGKTDTFDVVVNRELSPSEQWTSGVAYNPTVIQNQYVEKATGKIKGYNGWDWTGYMPCKGASTIVVPPIVEEGSTTGQAPASNAFFAEDHSVVQTAVTVSRTQYTTLTVPATASWIGLSSDRASLADCIALGIKPYA